MRRNAPAPGENGGAEYAKKTFCGHFADFKAIKLLQSQAAQEPLDCAAQSFFSAETEDSRFNFIIHEKQRLSHFADFLSQSPAIETLDQSPATRIRLASEAR